MSDLVTLEDLYPKDRQRLFEYFGSDLFLSNCKKRFNNLDSNGKGYLTKSQMKGVVQHFWDEAQDSMLLLGYEERQVASDRDVRDVMKQFGSDDGINFDQFVEFTKYSIIYCCYLEEKVKRHQEKQKAAELNVRLTRANSSLSRTLTKSDISKLRKKGHGTLTRVPEFDKSDVVDDNNFISLNDLETDNANRLLQLFNSEEFRQECLMKFDELAENVGLPVGTQSVPKLDKNALLPLLQTFWAYNGLMIELMNLPFRPIPDVNDVEEILNVLLPAPSNPNNPSEQKVSRAVFRDFIKLNYIYTAYLKEKLELFLLKHSTNLHKIPQRLATPSLLQIGDIRITDFSLKKAAELIAYFGSDHFEKDCLKSLKSADRDDRGFLVKSELKTIMQKYEDLDAHHLKKLGVSVSEQKVQAEDVRKLLKKIPFSTEPSVFKLPELKQFILFLELFHRYLEEKVKIISQQVSSEDIIITHDTRIVDDAPIVDENNKSSVEEKVDPLPQLSDLPPHIQTDLKAKFLSNDWKAENVEEFDESDPDDNRLITKSSMKKAVQKFWTKARNLLTELHVEEHELVTDEDFSALMIHFNVKSDTQSISFDVFCQFRQFAEIYLASLIVRKERMVSNEGKDKNTERINDLLKTPISNKGSKFGSISSNFGSLDADFQPTPIKPGLGFSFVSRSGSGLLNTSISESGFTERKDKHPSYNEASNQTNKPLVLVDKDHPPALKHALSRVAINHKSSKQFRSTDKADSEDEDENSHAFVSLNDLQSEDIKKLEKFFTSSDFDLEVKNRWKDVDIHQRNYLDKYNLRILLQQLLDEANQNLGIDPNTDELSDHMIDDTLKLFGGDMSTGRLFMDGFIEFVKMRYIYLTYLEERSKRKKAEVSCCVIL